MYAPSTTQPSIYYNQKEKIPYPAQNGGPYQYFNPVQPSASSLQIHQMGQIPSNILMQNQSEYKKPPTNKLRILLIVLVGALVGAVISFLITYFLMKNNSSSNSQNDAVIQSVSAPFISVLAQNNAQIVVGSSTVPASMLTPTQFSQVKSITLTGSRRLLQTQGQTKIQKETYFNFLLIQLQKSFTNIEQITLRNRFISINMDLSSLTSLKKVDLRFSLLNKTLTLSNSVKTLDLTQTSRCSGGRINYNGQDSGVRVIINRFNGLSILSNCNKNSLEGQLNQARQQVSNMNLVYQQCQKTLNQIITNSSGCLSNLTICQNSLSQFTSNSSSCLTNLNTCQKSLINAQENLTSYRNNLTNCQKNLNNSQSNITTYINNLALCQKGLNVTQLNLMTCENNSLICQKNLNITQESLVTHQNYLTTCRKNLTDRENSLTSCQKNLTTCGKNYSNCLNSSLCQQNLVKCTQKQNSIYSLCLNFSLDYQFIPKALKSYISQNYFSNDQILSILQVIKYLNKIKPKQNRVYNIDIFKKLVRSISCLKWNFNNYQDIYSKLSTYYLNSQQSFYSYLNISQSFSGQPLKYPKPSQSCQFQTTMGQNLNYPLTNCSQDNFTDGYTMFLFNGFANGPLKTFINLQSMYELISSDQKISSTQIFALGTRKKDFYIDRNFFANFFSLIEASRRTNWDQKFNESAYYQCFVKILQFYSDQFPFPTSIPIEQCKNISQFLVRQIQSAFRWNLSDYQLNVQKSTILSVKKRVLLIAHGYDTTYVNNMYNTSLFIESQKSTIKTIFLAPFTDNITDRSSNTSYISNPSDKMLSSMRQWLNLTTLKNNVPAIAFANSYDYGYNHQMVGYIRNYKDTIVQLIIQAKNSTKYPSVINTNLILSPLTVQLIWDSSTNLDLHIYQPGGNHVYYGNLNGNYGTLSGNSLSQGPEFYYTSCSKIVPGNYTFYVKYLTGTTAILTASAGNNQNFVKILPKLGYNDQNLFVLAINVKSQNEQSKKFIYRIYDP